MICETNPQDTLQRKKKVILTGDFNFNLRNFDKNKEVNEFLDLFTSNWFSPQILGPTRQALQWFLKTCVAKYMHK